MSNNRNSYLPKKVLEERDSFINNIRQPYARDITEIVYSKPFSRLRHKTQVFFDPKNDHICTRIEHSLHVATISRTIAEKLGFDTQLTEAIALGHDIGHLPFGHTGERVMRKLIAKKNISHILDKQYYLNISGEISENPLLHNINSYLWASHLTKKGKGLNLTYAVRDGILSHSNNGGDNYRLKVSQKKKDLNSAAKNKEVGLPVTAEGCIVKLADLIAFRARDLEDSMRAGIISENEIPDKVKQKLGETAGEIIDKLINDIVDNDKNENTFTHPSEIEHTKIGFSQDVIPALDEFKKFFEEKIFNSDKICNYENGIENLIFSIYDYLLYSIKKIGSDITEEELKADKDISDFILNYYKFRKKSFFIDWAEEAIIIYFISGFSDKFALQSLKDVFTLV